MRLDEIYREEPGGTFTHDGVEYWLNPVLALSDRFEVMQIPVEELSWILEYLDDDDVRDDKDIDVTAPVLIAKYNDTFAVIDGIHRLEKAVRLGLNTIPAKYIDNRLLSYAEKDK